jgi:hypothetical protein
MENTNPLQRFFRQPAIYIQLPSGGNFYPRGSLEMPENGELPVYPMTAMDEITYRTADALFNGSALTSVISSCVPHILDPWSIPNIDLDTILIAIRIASNGHEMELESRCPKCENENLFGLDLRSMLDQLKTPDYSKSVQLGDVEVFFKPLTYKQQNANTMIQFEDQKLLNSLPEIDINEEEKLKLLNEAFIKLGQANLATVAQSISMIKAGGDMVTEENYILEFLRNSDRKIYTAIRDHLVKIKENSELKPLKLRCQECEHDYESRFTLDMSNFFGRNS